MAPGIHRPHEEAAAVNLSMREKEIPLGADGLMCPPETFSFAYLWRTAATKWKNLLPPCCHALGTAVAQPDVARFLHSRVWTLCPLLRCEAGSEEPSGGW